MTYTTTVDQVAREGREFVRRMLEDWPYQPPEVIEPERIVVLEWLERSRDVLPVGGADSLRDLLVEWLEMCAAMGGGPRTDLTERTLQALGPRAFG